MFQLILHGNPKTALFQKHTVQTATDLLLTWHMIK